MLAYVICLTITDMFIMNGKHDTPDIQKAKVFTTLDKAKMFMMKNVGSIWSARYVQIDIDDKGVRTIIRYIDASNKKEL